MPRAIWTGVMQFVLISFPVKLYKATDDKGISFKNLHSVCGSAIRQKKWCEVCGTEILPTEINKGYEIAKGQFVIFEENEIENATPESSKIIKIEKAIPADEISVITYEDSYFLVPDKGGEHVYALLFNALSIKPKVLIGRVVIRNKEHLVAIRPYSGGLLFSMLHFADEVRDINEVVVIKEKKVDPAELNLATNLLDSLTGSFKDIDQRDMFREHIEKMAEMKATGQVITIEKTKPLVTTGGLVEALKQSIELSKAAAAAATVATATTATTAVTPATVETTVTAAAGKPELIGVKAEAKLPIKQQLDQMYGVTEEEIDRLILERKIEDEQERLKVLLELQKYKSFADYVKEHMQEFEGIELSPDFTSIIIADDKYPRINLPILKKIGIITDHFDLIVYLKSSKKQIVRKVKDNEILKFEF